MTKEEIITEIQKKLTPSLKKLVTGVDSGEIKLKELEEKCLCPRHQGMETFIKNQNIINNIKDKRNIDIYIDTDILRYCEADIYETMSMMNMFHDRNNEHKHEESENIFNEVLEQMGE